MVVMSKTTLAVVVPAPEITVDCTDGSKPSAERPREAPALLDMNPWDEHLQWYPPPARTYSRRELIADRCVNFLGVAVALIGMPVLGFASLMAGDSPLKQAGFWVFGLSMTHMLSCSALFHYSAWDWAKARKFLRLDHMGINAMIVGCNTPVMMHMECYVIFGIVLLLGALGIAGEAFGLYGDNDGTVTRCSILRIARYFVMGCAVLFRFDKFAEVPPDLFVGMIIGGLIYSLGVIFFLWKALEFHQSIWHTFVIIASIVFYMAYLSVLVGHP